MPVRPRAGEVSTAGRPTRKAGVPEQQDGAAAGLAGCDGRDCPSCSRGRRPVSPPRPSRSEPTRMSAQPVDRHPRSSALYVCAHTHARARTCTHVCTHTLVTLSGSPVLQVDGFRIAMGNGPTPVYPHPGPRCSAPPGGPPLAVLRIASRCTAAASPLTRWFRRDSASPTQPTSQQPRRPQARSPVIPVDGTQRLCASRGGRGGDHPRTGGRGQPEAPGQLRGRREEGRKRETQRGGSATGRDRRPRAAPATPPEVTV